MRNQINYLGISFELWSRQRTWFWSLVDPCRDGATIGAATTKAEAVHEARLTIEEKSARCAPSAAASRLARDSQSMSRFRQSRSYLLAMTGWENSLANLERYLADVCEGTG
jgi:hypothetical protein